MKLISNLKPRCRKRDASPSEPSRRLTATVVSACVLALSVGHAVGAPISVLGVNVQMDEASLRTALEGRGYTCELNAGGGGLTCEMALNNSRAKVDVNLREGAVYSIYFGCENFHSCGVSVRDTAQELVDAGVVDGMEYQSVRIDGPFITMNGDLEMFKDFPGFCARGTDSDRLCVIERNTLVPTGEYADVYLRLEGDGQGISFN